MRLSAAVTLSVAACAAPRSTPTPRASLGTEVVACGRRFDVGTPVVLWFEPGGYSAYSTRPSKETGGGGKGGPEGLRYRPGRATADPALDARIRAGDLDALREAVDLFVIHYDACGTSRRCFRVLQDERGLSVHFLLDVDGTVYQTLDLADQAWHARQANPRSVGVEIANVGAFLPDDPAAAKLDAWYETDDDGTRLVLPAGPEEEGLRHPEVELRPARPGRVVGRVQGRTLVQHDLTSQQYEALARLTAGLARVFPRLRLEVPRDADGRVRTTVLTDDELAAHSGLVGHLHVSIDKVDPGPAFDWEALLAAARAAREAGPAPEPPAP